MYSLCYCCAIYILQKRKRLICFIIFQNPASLILMIIFRQHEINFFHSRFIIGMLILACSASCSYYRRRRRLLALRNHMPPAGVVMFSSGNRQHAPQHPMTAQQPMPPSYQEATDKSFAYPPPYYAIGKKLTFLVLIFCSFLIWYT